MQRLAGWIVILTIATLALPAGIKLRAWTYDVTSPIRFFGDINRGCGWGLWASGEEGYLNQYEKMSIQEWDSARWLDYAPLRLGVMTLWGYWIREHRPEAAARPNDAFESWQSDRAFTQPVLNFNTGMELLGVVSAFLLTRHWVRRCDSPPESTKRGAPRIVPRPGWYTLRGAGAGLVAALILVAE